MKALAAEMTNYFSKRLEPLGITVKELTGDMQLTKGEILRTQVYTHSALKHIIPMSYLQNLVHSNAWDTLPSEQYLCLTEPPCFSVQCKC